MNATAKDIPIATAISFKMGKRREKSNNNNRDHHQPNSNQS